MSLVCIIEENQDKAKEVKVIESSKKNWRNLGTGSVGQQSSGTQWLILHDFVQKIQGLFAF